MSEAMQLLALLPDADEKLRHDSLEGETRFFAVLDDLAELALADNKLVELARERIKRLEERAESHRNIIRQMLEIAALPKVERPLFTASVSYPRKPIVTDATELPDAFIRHAPDMVAIGKALRAGNELPGAVLGNPEARLTLRTA